MSPRARPPTPGSGRPSLAFLPEAGCLVTRFVDGAPVPVEDLERVEIVGAVVRSVRALHACPPLPSSFPVFRIVEDYAALASGRGVHVPPAYDGGARPGGADRARRRDGAVAPSVRATTIC